VTSVFGTLQQIAKMDRADAQAAEDKGQLNYHVIMIGEHAEGYQLIILENMYIFIEDVSQLNIPVLAVFLERARGLYEENLSTYVKMILRRSFGRLMVSWEEEVEVLADLRHRTSLMVLSALLEQPLPTKYPFMLPFRVQP
jgi:hypothetical protein